ncbi:helix-turn-helix transcriptional regulator [Mycobacterium sp. CBMA293]|uniref:Helix-turn-helix protein n=2 Tax=unclassified Mycolicibacterium TaxID=2636767 RepID=A0A1S6GKP2_9MYCO|nr:MULTISPECIES: helix-turn-helix transcriptional regulator [unclassified Mycolicibacterium]AQS22426.1 Helix-turn-helix protein [Mycolicibacterium sp. CBMA 213]MUL50143.1 helix-turn-helix transcriptional regulator [Mycolicibacterium sp. CBMA 360]MUL62340.1 helix-turn-helix transcriptional regulator [Mycolicibacterium sp. CBMA 335]MUM04477.1 transcriptional regulator [Mycolicibacterium sp. CBMA 213]MUM14740.1 helix-turn-helix transcriptional regulator [Mycolicibacterium sp. CBMA 293]
MAGPNSLGDYLRARRNHVQPSDVGLPGGAGRRVNGLRREELALLAGISPDYYLRLEQGRDRNPSHKVIAALATALRLDQAGTDHLYQLANAQPPQHQRPAAEQLPDGIAELVDRMPMPALVSGRYHDVLASNALARAISPNFAPGRNLLRGVFLDPYDRALHLDWEQATAAVAGGLRQIAGAQPEDPCLVDLINDLSAGSARFRELWARADVGYRRDGFSHFRHPLVGEMHLRRNKLDIPHTDGQHLLVYHADPDTPTAAALQRLAATASLE